MISNEDVFVLRGNRGSVFHRNGNIRSIMWIGVAQTVSLWVTEWIQTNEQAIIPPMRTQVPPTQIRACKVKVSLPVAI
jgi:hypothetical protein